MKKSFYLLFSILFMFCISTQSNAQIFFTEDFEGTMNATTNIPNNWTESTAGATDGIYDVGDNLLANSASYWPVPAHTNFAQSNDDACNCDKSNDKLILPYQDFTSYTNGITLAADLYMDGRYSSTGLVEVSTDSGSTWTTVYTMPLVNGIWQDSSVIVLNAYAGQDSVLIAFRYEDNASWATGLGVDNVRLIATAANNDLVAVGSDVEYTSIPISQLPSSGYPLTANVRNDGTAAVTDAVVTANIYALPNTTTIVQTLSSTPTNIAIGTTLGISAGSFTPSVPGGYLFEYITSMTALTDGDNSNDTTRVVVTITGDGSYSRDDGSIAVSLGLNNNTFGELGNVFDYPNSGYKMDSVLFFFSSTSVGDTTSIKVYDVVGGVPSTQIGTSGDIIITAADTGGVVKIVPVTNMSGGPLQITSTQVFVAATDSYSGFLGLGFSSAIYTPGGTLANISGGAFSNMDLLGFPNPAIIRPFISYDCSVLTNTTSSTTSSCTGADGSATVILAGGSTPYTYAWDNAAGNQTTAVATGLAAGPYVVFYTDSMNCTNSDTVLVLNTNTPTLSAVVSSSFNGSDISCNQSSDGEATATGSGGTGTLTYAWSTNASNQTTAVVTGLTAGTYVVSVTDASSCTTVDSVTLSAPDTIFVIPDSLANVTCNGAADGLILVTTGGGTGSYTYLWSNGATTEDLTGLAPNIYSGTITDANGCTFSAALPIIEPAVLVSAIVDNANGSATASATGGTSPYSFQWDASANNQTTAIATGLTNNTYNCTVTDDNGCTTVESVTITGVGTDNIEGLSILNMFPNPAQNSVNIDIQLEHAMDVNIRVMNVTGQTVMESNLGSIENKRTTLKLSKLTNGVYTIQFTMGTETTTRKLIVNKQ
jgi:hypothetical protein